jgi:hypothetical protein
VEHRVFHSRSDMFRATTSAEALTPIRGKWQWPKQQQQNHLTCPD